MIPEQISDAEEIRFQGEECNKAKQMESDMAILVDKPNPPKMSQVGVWGAVER